MCQALLNVFDINNVVTLGRDDCGGKQNILFPHHMLSLVLLLSQTSTNIQKKLKLVNIIIAEDSLNILKSYFERINKNVDCLHLEKNWLSPSSAEIIGGIIKTNCLKTLAVVDNPITGVGIKEISDALSHLAHSSICSLVLSNVEMTGDDVCVLTKSLTEGSTIELLDISSNTLGRKGAVAIAEFLSTNRTVLSLNISHSKPMCLLPGENVDESFQEVTSCVQCVTLADALQCNPTITSLDVSDIMLAGFGMSYLDLLQSLLKNRKLQSLHLSGNFKISDIVASFIQCNTSLVSLNISDNAMYDSGMHAICMRGLLYVTTLKYFDISENFLNINSAEMIASILHRNTSLTCLALGSNQIGYVGCRYLATALLVNKTLTSLYIRHNMIGDSGAKELAGMLRRNTTLAHLDLSFNDIGDEGIMALLDSAMYNNDALKWLLVMFNSINDVNCIVPHPSFSDDAMCYAFCTNFSAIPVYSAQLLEKRILVTEKLYYDEWKQDGLGQICLQEVYDSLIPEDQKDCLKYYIQKKFGRDSSVVYDL